jgi:NTE family protein
MAKVADDGHICGKNDDGPGQIVLVLQGGGALGAFQAGVYRAMHEAGIEPDWVVGTSIGAISAALIAGNPREKRLAALDEFWSRVEDKSVWHGWSPWKQLSQSLSYMNTVSQGLPGFFVPNPAAFLGSHVPMDAETAGYYTVEPLEKSLNELVDFDLINNGPMRLTVGAAHVTTSAMRYFDSRESKIGVKHIMASGALPPAFPAVRIDGELYWDGGILSNTPAEVVFDDMDRKSSVVFAVHVWNPTGAEPRTMLEVAHRQKDVQYSSRVATHITRQLETHRLRHAIAELVGQMPEQLRQSTLVRELSAFGCLTRIHIVRLVAPRLDHEDSTKDVDFSPGGIARRREAGYENAKAAIAAAPWKGDFAALDGVVLHEAPAEGWGKKGPTPKAAAARVPEPVSPAMKGERPVKH